MSFYVYLLYSSATSGQQTYVGATVDLDHRLRQHNKEIKGGARATSIQVERGEMWERVCHIEGFPTWQAALQFEWRFKQITRKLPARMDPLKRRLMALKTLVSLDRSTSKAVPYAEWANPLQIVVEKERELCYSIIGEQYIKKIPQTAIEPVASAEAPCISKVLEKGGVIGERMHSIRQTAPTAPYP